MKAILVAGGHGSRLAPFTRYTQKTLLPIHERPVIDYALGTIRRAGIQDITIIANRFIGQIAQHVGTGLPGERIHYVMEEEPLGVAHALGLARPHNENTRLLIYFSDNITTVELADHVAAFEDAVDPLALSFSLERSPTRARLGWPCWTIPVEVVDIVEKPETPPSNLAIGGIYLYDERFWTFVDEAVATKGESFCISDINRTYVQQHAATLLNVGAETWVDCGTPATLLQASMMAKDGKLNPHPHRTEPTRDDV